MPKITFAEVLKKDMINAEVIESMILGMAEK